MADEIEFREEHGPVERQILGGQKLILRELRQLREEVKIMSTTAVTRDQLDAAIANLLTAEAARDAAVTTALNDLIAKVNAGTVAPEDFSAELASITTLQTNAAALTQTATADDPGSTVVPTDTSAESTAPATT